MSLVEDAYRFCGMFEAEILLELMFRHWNHPRAEDEGYRSDVLEAASEVLEASIAGQRLFEDIPCRDVNFVAAVHYVESMKPHEIREGENPEAAIARRQWVDRVRKALPSCFCPSDDLSP